MPTARHDHSADRQTPRRSPRPTTDLARRPIFEPLEPRQLLASLPFNLSFNAVAGGILDKDSQGTGFESVQVNKNGNQYQPSLIDLDTAGGVLKLTTNGSSAAGGNARNDNTLANGLQVAFDGTGTAPVEVRSKLVGGLGNISNGYEQAGIFLGPDQDNFVKLVAIHHTGDGGSRLEFSDEYDDGAGNTWGTISNGRISVGNWSGVQSLDLRIVANPSTGVVSAFYKIDGAANWSQVAHTITIPADKRAAFFNAASKAGLLAFDKSDSENLTASYDFFTVERQAPSTGPSVRDIRPAAGASGVLRDTFVAVDLNLPNGGLDPTTVTGSNVYLVNNATGQTIAATVNTTGGGDAITLTPSGLLAANTSYSFHITSGVKDVSGASFQPFQASFTTGTSVAESEPRVAFNRTIQASSVGIGWTGVTIGPDGKLYGVTADGEIHRFDLSADGSLTNRTLLFSYQSSTGEKRLITGIVFDTAQATMTGYVSHGQWIDPGNEQDRTAQEWTGKITRFTGSSLQNRLDLIVNLPRSVYDHLNNQPVFGPDGRLYWVQPSNTAMGAPDSTWGNRPEQLLTGTVLAADVRSMSGTTDVKTADGGTYDPFASGAPVKIYATGLRNGWDLVWTSSGHLFVPANGSAAGGNTPAGPGNNPPAIIGVNQTQRDYLFRIVQGGYYGHPNALRSEYVLNGGNPTSGADPAEVTQYPVGTQPDPDYRGFAYDFGLNVSPNGIIQYNSDGSHFGGALDGKLLVVRYSGGDDIVILDVAGNGTVTKAYVGSFGMTALTDPLDLIQDSATGNIYVVEAGFRSNGGNPSGLRISLLKPVAAGAAAAVAAPRLINYGAGPALHFSDIRGDATSGRPHVLTITNTGTGTLAFPADAFAITGSGAARFSISGAPGLPTSLAPGQSVTLTISFTATAKGIVTATLTIKSNDLNAPTQAISLRGLGTTGEGGSNEPSLQRILDLYGLPIVVGDPDPETTDYPSSNTVTGSEEVLLQTLKKAGTGPVRIELLASMGTANANAYTDTSALSWYNLSTLAKTEILRIAKTFAQTVNVTHSGSLSFDPAGDFGLVGTFFDFGPRDVWSQDTLNTWESNANERRKVRFFPLKNESGAIVPNAFVFALEEWDVASDQNDIVGIIYNVQPAGNPANALLVNANEVPFSDRLVLHRIRDLDPNHPNLVHDIATLNITNNGGQPLVISSISSSSADFAITSGGTGAGAVTVQPGATHTVKVRFVYNDPWGLGCVLRSGTLTILSNSTSAPSQTVQLRGIWQSDSEAGNNAKSQEPNLYEIVQALGYAIDVGPNLGRDDQTGTNTGGNPIRIGSETLSSYFRKANSGQPVTIHQIAAWHQQTLTTNTRTRWYLQGNPGNPTFLYQHDYRYSQTFFPPMTDGVTPSKASFDPGTSAFGFKFDGVFSDYLLNANPYDGGHGMRWYALHDRAGNRIPNTWLVAQDYAGSGVANFDYQDNIYIVHNIRPVTGPTAPTNVTASGSDGGILLSWTRNTEGNLAGYNIYRSDSAGGTYTKVNSGLITANSFNDAAAPAGQTSFYRIVPVDDNSTEGTAATTSATRPNSPTIPAAPSNLAAGTVTYNQVSLTWDDNSNNETGFRLQRSVSGGAWANVATLAANITSYTDGSVAAQTSYRYRVVSYNGVGESAPSNTVEVNTPANPGDVAAPQNLRATDVQHDRVALAWDDASNNETGFRIERRTGAGGSWTTLTTLPANSSAFTDTTALSQTAYDYRVIAFNGSGQSPASNVVSVTTPRNPGDLGTPGALSAGTVAFNRVVLGWIDNSDNESGFRIERAPGSGGSFAAIGTVGAGVTSFADQAVAQQTQYRYRVVAFNSFGESGPSNVVTVTTPRDPSEIDPPTNLRTTTLEPFRVMLAWNDNSDNETGFLVQRAPGSGGNFVTFATVSADATAWTDNSPQPRTAYRYRVIAINSVGQSPASNVLSVTTPGDPSDVAPPSNFEGSTSFGAVNLGWSDNSDNETHFILQRRAASSGTWSQLTIVGQNATGFVDTTVSPSTDYVYRVAAANAQAQSPWSSELSVTAASADAFVSSNIGDAGGATTTVTPNVSHDVTATGGAVGGTADDLRFVHRLVTGDFDYRVRLASFSGADAASVAGVMVRETIGTSSTNVFLRGGAELRLSYRETLGGGTAGVGQASQGTPVWLRMSRSGNVFTAFWSADGASWTQLAQVNVGMPAAVRLGLAVSSSSTSTTSAQFREFGIVQAQAPQPPVGTSAQVNGSHSVRLRWEDAASNEAGYRVERRLTGTTPWQSMLTLAEGSDDYTDATVIAGQSYEYRVVAFNSAGASPGGVVVADIPDGKPNPPTVTGTASAVRGGASLSWPLGGVEVASFRIERREGMSGGWSALSVVGGRATGVLDATAQPGRIYQYRLIAIGTVAESDPSAMVTVAMPFGPELARPGASILSLDERTNRLSWSDKSEGESRYVVQRRLAGGDWAELAILPGDSTGYLDRALRPGMAAEYRVRAEFNGSSSAWSHPVATTTPVEVQWQTALIGAGGGATAIRPGVHYDLQSGGRDVWGTADELVLIHRAVTGDFDYAVRVIGLVGFEEGRMAGLMVRSTDSAASANAFVALRPDDVRLTARQSDGGTTTAEGSAVRPAARPWLRLKRSGDVVIAFAGTDGLHWAEVGRVNIALGVEVLVGLAASAQSYAGTVTAQFRDVTDLRAAADLVSRPGNLAAQLASGGVQLGWADPTAGRWGFLVQRRVVGGLWQALASVAPGSSSYVDSTILPANVYQYRVAVDTAAGAGAFTSPITVVA